MIKFSNTPNEMILNEIESLQEHLTYLDGKIKSSQKSMSDFINAKVQTEERIAHFEQALDKLK